MKICFLAGADSIHSYRWVKYFSDRGHAVHWVSFAPSRFGSIEKVSFHEIKPSPFKALNSCYGAVRLKRLLNDIQPDILHAHYIGTYGLAGAITGFHPFITTAWGSDILFAGRSRVKGPFIKYVLRQSDLITCDAEHMRKAMLELGAAPEKIKTVYFGTDTQRFCPGEKNEALRNKLGIPHSRFILSLRSFELVYDVQSLIKAIPHVLKEVPDAIFVVVGKGSEEGRLKALAESLNVSENIRFLGSISNDDLLQCLISADVYVSTSLSDAGLSSSTAEAMACGLSVVITDSGENKLWVKDGENGFIVRVKDPVGLGEKIVCLLKNDGLRARLGMLGRKTIVEKSSYYVEMGKMEEMCKALTKSNA